MSQGRGMLTDRIKTISKELFGYEISVCELRLMAHIIYVLMNEQRINRKYVNLQEISVIDQWVAKGYVGGDWRIAKLAVTKDFWEKMSEIVWFGYVVNDKEI